jgi:hypothetical protein
METNTLSEIFNSFVSKDKFKPVLNKPFELNDRIYATDAYSLIRINKKDCDFTVQPEDSAPNCEAVIPIENMNQLLTIDKDFFEQYKTEDELTELGEDVECETCDGFGEVEWEFQHYTELFDCPVCKGDCYTERVKNIKTGNKTFGKDLVKIKEAYLDINKFYKILETKEKLGEPLYLIHQSTPNKAVLFRVGICEILIMPYMYNNDDAKKVIDLNL